MRVKTAKKISAHFLEAKSAGIECVVAVEKRRVFKDVDGKSFDALKYAFFLVTSVSEIITRMKINLLNEISTSSKTV